MKKLDSSDHIYKMKHVVYLFFPLNKSFEVSAFLEGDRVTARVVIASDTFEGCADLFEFSNGDVKDTMKLAVFRACEKILPDYFIPWGLKTGIRPCKPIRLMLEMGYGDDEIFKIYHDQYLVTPCKVALALEIAKKQISVLKSSDKEGVGLYINIPFCPTKCVYCSFISMARDKDLYLEEYLACLHREIAYTAEIIKSPIETIYIGGGTPTILCERQLGELLNHLSKCFSLGTLKEFVVEAGRPDTITYEKLKILKEYGVGRICINPQTMNDQTLIHIGRKHDSNQVRHAYEMAHKVGFETINSDVIAGLPGEGMTQFAYTLEEIIKLNPTSVTVHTLYLKNAAALVHSLPNYSRDQDPQDMLTLAYHRLKEQDMSPYYLYKQKSTLNNLENVGYAKRGKECLYNILMMEDERTVAACGAGAVTKLVEDGKITRSFNVKEPKDYILRIDEMIKRKDLLIK